MNGFGEAVLDLRSARGWTQEELSEYSGVSVRTIRNLECGRIQRPRRSSVDLLLAVLDPERTRSDDRSAVPVAHGTARAGVPGAGTAAPLRPQTSIGAERQVRWRGRRSPDTALIGRAKELERLRPLISSEPVVVMTGPGGVGKTRLALALADFCAGDFPGGVAVAELGWLPSDQKDASAAYAAAYNQIESTLGGDVAAQADVGGREVPGRAAASSRLLVLDNTEHLPHVTAALVLSVRRHHPGTRILITTRRPPPLADAWIADVPPLGVEGGGTDGPSAALQLLLERMSAVGSPSDLGTDLTSMDELCRQLDGLPRAIEFAADRLRTVPLLALDNEQDVLYLLETSDQSGLPHQRSVSASLSWSWELLDRRQQQVLEGVAALPDGFTRHEAQLACGSMGLFDAELLAVLAGLADASLLQVRRDHDYHYSLSRSLKVWLTSREGSPPTLTANVPSRGGMTRMRAARRLPCDRLESGPGAVFRRPCPESCPVGPRPR